MADIAHGILDACVVIACSFFRQCSAASAMYAYVWLDRSRNFVSAFYRPVFRAPVSGFLEPSTLARLMAATLVLQCLSSNLISKATWLVKKDPAETGLCAG